VAKNMIQGNEIVPCPYVLLSEEDTPSGASNEALPLEGFLAWAENDNSGERGVIIEPGETVDSLQPLLHRASYVAISFPKFSDGRGYSHARRLRKNLEYKGPIVSFGDVLRDQLMHMKRCGISAFIMRDDQDLSASLEVFERFPTYYQKAL